MCLQSQSQIQYQVHGRMGHQNQPQVCLHSQQGARETLELGSLDSCEESKPEVLSWIVEVDVEELINTYPSHYLSHSFTTIIATATESIQRSFDSQRRQILHHDDSQKNVDPHMAQVGSVCDHMLGKDSDPFVFEPLVSPVSLSPDVTIIGQPGISRDQLMVLTSLKTIAIAVANTTAVTIAVDLDIADLAQFKADFETELKSELEVETEAEQTFREKHLLL